MYGKTRIGVTRHGVAFIAGGGGHQNVGRIVPAVPTSSNRQGKGYDVFFCNWKYVGTAETKIKAKILMFNAAKNHKDYCSADDWCINEKGQLYINHKLKETTL